MIFTFTDMNISSKKLTSLFCTLLCLFTACTHNEVTPETGEKTIEFCITNYMQYDLDEGTRAIPVSESTILKHLALGVFDEATGKIKDTLLVQDKNQAGYGSFTTTLPYGHYRLVFLGYSGDKACHMDSPEHIYFDGNYVPQTFTYTSILTVNQDTPTQIDITLRRVVSAFRLHMEDAIPENANEFRCVTTGGGTVLNALTGLTAEQTGRETTISIADNFKGQTGKELSVYLFLASTSENMDIKVSAIDNKSNVIVSRTFPSVPMKVNTLTVYKGSFFAGLPYGFSITVEDNWDKTVTNEF